MNTLQLLAHEVRNADRFFKNAPCLTKFAEFAKNYAGAVKNYLKSKEYDDVHEMLISWHQLKPYTYKLTDNFDFSSGDEPAWWPIAKLLDNIKTNIATIDDYCRKLFDISIMINRKIQPDERSIDVAAMWYIWTLFSFHRVIKRQQVSDFRIINAPNSIFFNSLKNNFIESEVITAFSEIPPAPMLPPSMDHVLKSIVSTILNYDYIQMKEYVADGSLASFIISISNLFKGASHLMTHPTIMLMTDMYEIKFINEVGVVNVKPTEKPKLSQLSLVTMYYKAIMPNNLTGSVIGDEVLDPPLFVAGKYATKVTLIITELMKKSAAYCLTFVNSDKFRY